MEVSGTGKKYTAQRVAASSSSQNSALQGATSISDVPAGATHQKKTTNLKQINEILNPALSGFRSMEKVVAEEVKTLTSQCMEIVKSTNASDTDQVKLEKKLDIAEKMLAAREAAIRKYDEAISEVKKIKYDITLQGNAVKGSVKAALSELGLAKPTAMALANRLRDIRAQAYDDLQLAKAWHTYLVAMQDHTEVNAATTTIQSLQELQQADPAQLTAKQKEALATADSTISEQHQIYKEKNDSAILKYGECADLLAPLPCDALNFPDSLPAKDVLKNALNVGLALRNHIFEHDVLAAFHERHKRATDHYKSLSADWNTLKTHEEIVPRLNQLRKLGAEAREAGMEAMKYAERTIELYDMALAANTDAPEPTQTGLWFAKQKAQGDLTKLKMDAFDMRRMELPLLVQAAENHYDPGLVENFYRANSVLTQVKTIHDYCTHKMVVGNPDEGTPMDLLHRVLKTVPDGYEDAVRQTTYIARQFEKRGKKVEDNDLVVKELKNLADSIRVIAKLAESQLGQVEFAGKANLGTDDEAKTWIEATLKFNFPQLYPPAPAEEEVDEATEELAEMDIGGSIESTSTTADAKAKTAEVKGPTPSQKNQLKVLSSAITAAEKATNSEQTKKDLALLEAESERQSRNARLEAQEGGSPCAVEDLMKLAANAESALADKKTRIAKKYRRALDKMETNHQKYQTFKTKLSELTEEAERHKTAHDGFIKEGQDLRIEISKMLPPTDSLFNYLYEKGQIKSVARKQQRVELESRDKEGKPRINPRTNEQVKDYIDEYVIKLEGEKKFVAHFHYRSMDANDNEVVACHFKTWDQRAQGLQYVMREAEENRDVEIHRGRTNLETLMILKQLASGTTV